MAVEKVKGTQVVNYEQDFSHINVYRQIFGIWFLRARINRDMGEDGMELFRKTRDHYRKVFGYDNIYKFEIKWETRTHIFNGITHEIK